MAFNIDELVKQATEGQDTSVKTDVKIASGKAATSKSESGLN